MTITTETNLLGYTKYHFTDTYFFNHEAYEFYCKDIAYSYQYDTYQYRTCNIECNAAGKKSNCNFIITANHLTLESIDSDIYNAGTFMITFLIYIAHYINDNFKCHHINYIYGWLASTDKNNGLWVKSVPFYCNLPIKIHKYNCYLELFCDNDETKYNYCNEPEKFIATVNEGHFYLHFL